MRKCGNRARSVSVISGSDGPTSVFIAGKTGGKCLDIRNIFRRKKYKWRRKRLLKHWKGKAHTLEELIAYMMRKYGAKEISRDTRAWKECRRNFKNAIVQSEFPELIGPPVQVAGAEAFSDNRAIAHFIRACEARDAAIDEIPDDKVSMDCRCYKIAVRGCGSVQVEMEVKRGLIGTSCTIAPGKRKQIDRIHKDIYRYYGMSKKDMEENTPRAKTVIGMLTAD